MQLSILREWQQNVASDVVALGAKLRRIKCSNISALHT